MPEGIPGREDRAWAPLQFPSPAPCRGVRQPGSFSDTPSALPALGRLGRRMSSAQTMVEEAALAAFPSCSPGSRGSTQGRARFSSWIHMKHPCADCSLPPGSGSGAHEGNRGAEPQCGSRAGSTMRGKQRAGLCLLPFTSPA